MQFWFPKGYLRWLAHGLGGRGTVATTSGGPFHMTTVARSSRGPADPEHAFFLNAAFAMALVIGAGFTVQLILGRSSFAAPPLVHAHAVVFMGWVTLYLVQTGLVATGHRVLHRRLGWVAAGWIALMLPLGVMVTVALVRQGHAPFFFRPLQFLVFDPATLAGFAGLTVAAIGLRRRADWHKRLNFSAMALLLGPGFGRLLPMPLLSPWAWEATLAACAIFPLVGVLRDLRQTGKVHPAWMWGLGAMAGCLVMTELITYSPVGMTLYRQATAGSPGAAVAPLGLPAPPVKPAAPSR